MGPPDDRGLKAPLLVLVGLLVLGALGLWLAPGLARRVVTRHADGRAAVVGDAGEVDRFLETQLATAGVSRLMSREEQEGVVRATWQLAPGQRPEAVGEALERAAQQAHIELHARSRDLLDLELRVYAGSRLRQELLLVPALAEVPPLPPPVNRRERPLLALILAGLGQQEAGALVRTPLPLTVAIEPWTPFALSTAREAAMAWQEVLVDLGEGVDDLPGALATIPFASGALSRQARIAPLAPALLAGLARPVLVSVATPAEDVDPSLPVLVPWQARRRALSELLARIRVLAARDGVTAVLIEPTDPSLGALLQWATQTEELRLVHASEAVRPADVLGIRDAENPRAQAP